MTMRQHKPSLLRRLLLAATLATGFATLWLVLVMWLGTSILESWRGTTPRRRETLLFTTDGTPLIETVSFDNLSRVTYRDLDGRVRDVDRGDLVPGMSLHGGDGTAVSVLSQAAWQRRIRVFMDEREPGAVWYFVHDGRAQGAGYFVGYERISNRLIGYIGLSGFRAQPIPRDERIPVTGALALDFSSWSSAPLTIASGPGWAGLRPGPVDLPPRLVHVPSGDRLRLVDLAARTVTTVFEAPAPIVSLSIPVVSSYTGYKPTKERPILVRAGRTIIRLDHGYNVIGTFNIPPEIDRRTPVDWYEADSGRALAVFIRGPGGERALRDQVTRATIYQVARDASIEHSFEITLETGANMRNDQATLPLMALGIPAPAALLVALSLTDLGNPGRDDATALAALLKQSWPYLAAVLAISAVLAGAARRRARAFGLSRREQTAWALFVLLFGVPAGVGFLLHRRWPVRLPCPHCHARSARDRDACAECGTPFPAPALLGSEIFA